MDAKKRKEGGIRKLGGERKKEGKTDGGEAEERKAEEKRDCNLLGVEGSINVDLGAKIAQGVGSPDVVSGKASAEMVVSDGRGVKRATSVGVETPKTRGHDQNEARVRRNEYEAAIEEAELSSEEEEGAEKLEEEDNKQEEEGGNEDKEEEGGAADHKAEERRAGRKHTLQWRQRAVTMMLGFRHLLGKQTNGKAKGKGLETIHEIEEGEGETGRSGRSLARKHLLVCNKKNKHPLIERRPWKQL
jgi:hypothetical protein